MVTGLLAAPPLGEATQTLPGSFGKLPRLRYSNEPSRAATGVVATSVPLQAVPLTEASLAEFDGVVILADHQAFDYDLFVRAPGVVVDTRNATAAHRRRGPIGTPRPSARRPVAS